MLKKYLWFEEKMNEGNMAFIGKKWRRPKGWGIWSGPFALPFFFSEFTTFQNSFCRYLSSTDFTQGIVLGHRLQIGIKLSLRYSSLLVTENQVLLVLVVTCICTVFWMLFSDLLIPFSRIFPWVEAIWGQGSRLRCPVPYCIGQSFIPANNLSRFFIYPKCSLSLV